MLSRSQPYTCAHLFTWLPCLFVGCCLSLGGPCFLLCLVNPCSTFCSVVFATCLAWQLPFPVLLGSPCFLSCLAVPMSCLAWRSPCPVLLGGPCFLFFLAVPFLVLLVSEMRHLKVPEIDVFLALFQNASGPQNLFQNGPATCLNATNAWLPCHRPRTQTNHKKMYG